MAIAKTPGGRESERGEMFEKKKKMKKKLIPRIYSTHITPSYLGLYSGFRKKVEGVRGGTQRTGIKMGSEGGEGGQAASGRIGGKLIGVTHTWATVLRPLSHVSRMKALIGQRLRRGRRSRLSRACIIRGSPSRPRCSSSS